MTYMVRLGQLVMQMLKVLHSSFDLVTWCVCRHPKLRTSLGDLRVCMAR